MQATDEFDETVALMMDDYGADIEYVKTTVVYNPADGGTTETTSTYDTVGILMDLGLASNGFSYKYNTSVQQGDKEIFVRPPSRIDPLVTDPVITPGSDKIIFAGVHYTVVTYKEINPDGATPLVWMFYVRR